jgi:hypothetical protein
MINIMNKQIYIYIYEDSEYLNKKEILLIMKYQKQNKYNRYIS